MDRTDEIELIPNNDNIPVQSRMERLINQCRIKQCIHPLSDHCSEKIINAHSIQNNKILNKIGKNGKVILLRPEATKTSFDIVPKEKGRKVTSTFTGFCGHHDKTVFQPIEDHDYTGNLKQQFLFAYRAFAYEYHKKIEAFKGFNQFVSAKPKMLLNEANVLLYRGYQFSLEVDLPFYLKKFNDAILTKNYDEIQTIEIRIEGAACFAACSGFGLEYDLERKRLIPNRFNLERLKIMFLNVFPQENETIALFSWLRDDEIHFKSFKDQLLNIKEQQQKKNLINNLLPTYCENFALGPDLWDSFTTSEKNALLYVFGITTVFKTHQYLKPAKYDLFKVKLSQ